MRKPVRRRAPMRRRRGRKMALKRAITNKNQNTFSTACRWEAGVSAISGSGPVQNYVYGSGSALAGAYSLASTREYQVYSKIFDQFRVTGVTLKYIPRANVQSVSEVNVQSASSGFPTTQVIYSSWDEDGAIPSSVGAIQTMRSTRKHSLLRTWKRSFRYTYKDNSWLDTDTQYDVTPALSNWKSKGLYGNFGFYGENVPFSPGAVGSPVVAQMEVIYHVVFRGQRLINVSLDESGQILLGNPEPEMKEQSGFEVHTVLKPLSDTNECDLDIVT